MEYRPSVWLHTLVDAVADCMATHHPMGAMGWRYQEEDESVELIVYATPVALVGGAHDGAIVVPGFSLDVQALQALFEGVTALQWQAHGCGPDDEEGPHLSLEGTYQGHHVWLRVLAEAPDDEEPGLTLDTSLTP
jgi:hypothetical protein